MTGLFATIFLAQDAAQSQKLGDDFASYLHTLPDPSNPTIHCNWTNCFGYASAVVLVSERVDASPSLNSVRNCLPRQLGG